MDICTAGPTLVLAGEFDVRNTFEVRTALYDHLEAHLGGTEPVVVDLSEVTSIDITALRVLAVATRAAAQAGHHLRLRGLQPPVRRMIHLARLARHVDVEREPISA